MVQVHVLAIIKWPKGSSPGLHLGTRSRKKQVAVVGRGMYVPVSMPLWIASPSDKWQGVSIDLAFVLHSRTSLYGPLSVKAHAPFKSGLPIILPTHDFILNSNPIKL